MQLFEYYKREKNIRSFNNVKYYVISSVLDILVRHIVAGTAKEDGLTFEDLKKDLWANSTYQMDWEIVAARIDLIIAEMSWMNLIVKTSETNNNPNIQLTDDGFEAYKDQKYHTIAASLMEAKETRNLAIIAIVVSIITLIVTIVSIWLS